MVLAQHALERFKHAFVEGLSLAIAALSLVKKGQIVDACKRSRMVLAEFFFSVLQGLTRQHQRIGIFAVTIKLGNLGVCCADCLGSLQRVVNEVESPRVGQIANTVQIGSELTWGRKRCLTWLCHKGPTNSVSIIILCKGG